MPGTVSFADWQLSWSIPTGWGGGLVISQARFRGDLVLYKGTQPFVLVPYHGNSPMFKDGLNHLGAPFTPVFRRPPMPPPVRELRRLATTTSGIPSLTRRAPSSSRTSQRRCWSRP